MLDKKRRDLGGKSSTRNRQMGSCLRWDLFLSACSLSSFFPEPWGFLLNMSLAHQLVGALLLTCPVFLHLLCFYPTETTHQQVQFATHSAGIHGQAKVVSFARYFMYSIFYDCCICPVIPTICSRILWYCAPSFSGWQKLSGVVSIKKVLPKLRQCGASWSGSLEDRNDSLTISQNAVSKLG